MPLERAWNVGFRTPFFWKARVPLLLGVVALSSVASHMPARYRNYSVLRRRVVTAEPRPGP